MKCPVDNFDYTKIYNGKEAVSHTIGRWEFYYKWCFDEKTNIM